MELDIEKRIINSVLYSLFYLRKDNKINDYVNNSDKIKKLLSEKYNIKYSDTFDGFIINANRKISVFYWDLCRNELWNKATTFIVKNKFLHRSIMIEILRHNDIVCLKFLLKNNVIIPSNALYEYMTYKKDLDIIEL